MLPILEEIPAENQDSFQRASIKKLAGHLDPSLRVPLAQYLSGSHPLLAAGNVQDPMSADEGAAVPFGYRTDGEWVWPTYWGYFVKEYGVEVPEEFIEHARRRNFIPVALSGEELDLAEQEFEERFFN
ncbi:hypothetical protein WKI65_38910 [Streptomyces sp. MS1.AVA.3]|uniref:hypothetical protein n=1 Tax=Streptomyces decoyicus TaxID=249567 RepID=UPI0030C142F4